MAEYIDKDKTLKELLDWCAIYGYGGLSTNDIKRIFKKNIPAVKKHGEWVRHPNKNIEFIAWDVCTACGIGCKRREYDGGGMTEYNYRFCPNCGAYMQEEKYG